VGTLGQGDGRENADTKSGGFRARGSAHVHVCAIDGKGSFASGIPAARQMNRAYRHHTGDHSLAALNGDPMPLELLIEELRHLPWDPPQSEITVLPNVPHHVSRLVQRTHHQAPYRPTPDFQTGVAGAIPNRPGQEMEESVHHRLFVPGDCRDRCQAARESGQAVAILCSRHDWQCRPEQGAGANHRSNVRHEGEGGWVVAREAVSF
jgi:hypothetical protein